MADADRPTRPSPPYYFPLAPGSGLVLVLLAALAVGLIEVGALEYTYARIGVGHHFFGALLLLSLLGSLVNLPLAELPAESVVGPGIVRHAGVGYRIPSSGRRPCTIVAINVGGALVPTGLALYLIAVQALWFPAVIATLAVVLVANRLAKPVQGLGIAVPIFIPPIAAAAASVLLDLEAAPALAYASGTLGTLIGADLLNLGRIRSLGAPVISIGGAGTFDGIFLTGVLAVLIA